MDTHSQPRRTPDYAEDVLKQQERLDAVLSEIGKAVEDGDTKTHVLELIGEAKAARSQIRRLSGLQAEDLMQELRDMIPPKPQKRSAVFTFAG